MLITDIVNEQADLQVTKTCDSSVLAGQSGKCTIYVDNNGPSTARSVVLTDAATSNGTFTMSSASPSQGTCSGTPSTGSNVAATCALGNLGPATINGPGRATVVVTYTATEGQSISDTDRDDLDARRDPRQRSASASLPVTAVADLEITADTGSPSPVTAGTALTYSVTVRNNGPSTARSVVLGRASGRHHDHQCRRARATACNVGVPGDPLQPTTCGFDVLVRTHADDDDQHGREAPDDGGLHSDAAAHERHVRPEQQQQLQPHRYDGGGGGEPRPRDVGVADADCHRGPNLTYTATITNAGPSTARTVGLFETLPAGVTFAGTNISNGGSGTCAQVVGHPDEMQCQLNDLDPGRPCRSSRRSW